jgi:hypothetical protein
MGHCPTRVNGTSPCDGTPAAFSGIFEQSAPYRLEAETNREMSFPESGPVPINLADVEAAIEYPRQAIEAGFEGILTVSILVDETGQYAGHAWLTPGPSYLSEALDPYLDSILFLPARLRGQAVVARVVIPFRFRLKVPRN